VIGGKKLLTEIGFDEEDGSLKLKEVNHNRLNEFVGLINNSLQRF